MANDPKTNPQPPANQPLVISKGKPYVHDFPTPNPDDRVFYIRKDSRVAGYQVPQPGTPFEGKGQFEKLLEGFVFATAKPADEAGQFNWFYVNQRKNQEAYNFSIDYPYVDKNYPKLTRTYVLERTNALVAQEPNPDDRDPIFPLLQLTDHKIERLSGDPVMDAVFVQVTRVFERLPGPIITSFHDNQFQQTVSVKTQEVVRSAPAPQSSVTEHVTQERSGKAKAKNTVESVPTLFPNTTLGAQIPSMTRELWLGGFTEQNFSQMQAGQIVQPNITPGNYQITEKQATLFKKEITINSLPLPQTRIHQELTKEFGGGVVTEQLDLAASGLSIDQGFLVTDAHIRNLDGFGQVKMTKTIDQWPVLYETETDPKLGIVVQMRKSVVPAGTIWPPGVGVNPGETYVDIKSADKWRSIQIVSTVPGPLPPDVSWDVVEHLDLPAILTSLGPAFTDSESSEAHGEFNGVATGVDGEGQMDVTSHTRDKINTNCIARAFGSASAKHTIKVGSSFELTTTRPFFGYSPAVVTRHISNGPMPLFPNPGNIRALAGPSSILYLTPISGVATIIDRTFEEAETDGCDKNMVGSTTDLVIRNQTFGPMLVGGINPVTNKPFNTLQPNGQPVPNVNETRINDGTNQNTWQLSNGVLIYRHYYPNYFTPPSIDTVRGYAHSNAELNAASRTYTTHLPPPRLSDGKNVRSEVRVTLPSSAPGNFVSGNRIIVKIEVEVWRLNIYVYYITSVVLP